MRNVRRAGGLSLYRDEDVAGLSELTARIHAHGALASVQLMHGGCLALPDVAGHIFLVSPVCGRTPYADSSVLTVKDIRTLVRRFAEAAARAVAAGFDAVELHGAHGYLLAQFFSPLMNRRGDEYGGSLENRMRFPLEVLKAVREAVGETPVLYRMSVVDGLHDGIQMDDSLELAVRLAREGADALHVSVGTRETRHIVAPPSCVPCGWNASLARAVKSAVGSSVPVIVAGRLNDAALLERCVAEGLADMVAVGRGLIADPGLVEKIRDGRPEDIRYCVACNQGCCDALFRGESVGCMLNARASFERERRILPAEVKKNVAIVGAGPAGMETARVAAMRGHNVTLFERGETGGKLSLIAAPPEKDSFLLFSSYLKTQLDKAGVRIIRREVRSPEDIAEVSPDHVVIATGAQQTIPPIPGADLPCVMSAEDVLAGRRFPGASAVIIGGGLVGVETAHFLAAKGVKVTILEKLDAVAREAGATCVEHIHDMLKKYAVDVRTGVNIECITKEGVRTSEAFHAAEAVVIAAGYAPRTGLADAMRRAFGQVSVIGDARGSANVLQAVHDGFLCASQL